MRKSKLIFMILVLTIFVSACSVDNTNIVQEENLLNSNENIGEALNLDRTPDNVYISKEKGITVRDLYGTEGDISMAMEYIGLQYPELRYADKDGREYLLSEIDKPIILKYSWGSCDACLGNEPILQEFKDNNSDKYEVISLLTNPSEIDKEKILSVNPDSELYELYGENTIGEADVYKYGVPFFLFIDENKEIKLIYSGAFEAEQLPRLLALAFD